LDPEDLRESNVMLLLVLINYVANIIVLSRSTGHIVLSVVSTLCNKFLAGVACPLDATNGNASVMLSDVNVWEKRFCNIIDLSDYSANACEGAGVCKR